MKRKNIIMITVGVLLTVIVLMYSSYALFTTNQISKSVVTIKAGTMNPTIKVDGTAVSKLTVSAGAKKTFTVTLENLNSISGKFLFYYTGTLPSGVKFGYLEETGKNVPPGINGVVLAKSGKDTYSLYVNNSTNSSVTINLESLGGLSNQPLSIPSNGHVIEKIINANSNIMDIYTYDQTSGSSTFCVTGEESTCVAIDPPSTYEVGTIIKYKVNDSTEKYFYVVSDNGDTLTLQQRENTVYSTAWYASADDNVEGPLTILPALEEATKDWTNVLDQTYTLGTTVFKDNAYTGCTSYESSSCTTNVYTLPKRTAKARMITNQELSSLGCTNENESCPVWVYNYLYQSPNYGGTVSQNPDWGYWTSSAQTIGTVYAWQVFRFGNVRVFDTSSNTRYGARAVVVIEK